MADEIREFADGAQALAVYAAERADSVWIDIKMKTMDGITARRHIMAAAPSRRSRYARVAVWRKTACSISLLCLKQKAGTTSNTYFNVGTLHRAAEAARSRESKALAGHEAETKARVKFEALGPRISVFTHASVYCLKRAA